MKESKIIAVASWLSIFVLLWLLVVGRAESNFQFWFPFSMFFIVAIGSTSNASKKIR